MTERVSCPYCNTGISPSHTPDSGRISCPRCGECFVIPPPSDAHSALAGEKGIIPVSVNGTYSPTTGDRPRGLGGLRSLALLSGGLTLVIACGFVFFFLPRSPKQTTTTTAPPIQPATTQPPAVLPGLGYLPPHSQLIAAVQPSSLSIYAGRTHTDLRELLVKLGLPQPMMAILDAAALPLEDVESVVAGLIFPEDNAIPQGVIVLALRKPLLNPAAFREALQAKRSTASHGRKHETIAFHGFPLELLERDAKTYIIATDGKLLTAAAQRPRTGISALSTHLRSELTQLSPASCAWIASDSLNWSRKPTMKLLAGLSQNPDLPERLSHLRSFTAGLSLEPDLQLKVMLTTDTTDSASTIRKRVSAHAVTGSGDRIEWDTRVDPSQGFQVLGEFVADLFSPPQP